MRRRRRPAVTWAPTLGTANGPTGFDDFSGRVFRQVVDNTGLLTTNVIPLIFDQPQETESVTLDTPLSNIVGSEYFLRRIVGKLHAFVDGIGEANVAVLLGAGFFIARAQDEATGNGSVEPIGFTSGATANLSYSTIHPDSIREPWIWRRTWILSKARTGAIDQSGIFDFPATTAGYGSVADGPHIDAKTRRRVVNDDRLYFSFSTVMLEPSSASQVLNTSTSAREPTTTTVRAVLDYRAVLSLRKARNRGNF